MDDKDKQIEQLQAANKELKEQLYETQKDNAGLLAKNVLKDKQIQHLQSKLDKAVERIDKEIEKHINSSIEYRRTGLNESAVTHKVLQQGLQKAKEILEDCKGVL